MANIKNHKNEKMYLEKILLFEDVALKNLSDDSKAKNILNEFKEKLIIIENRLKDEPSGKIIMKESGNIFVSGFSNDLTKEISQRMYS